MKSEAYSFVTDKGKPFVCFLLAFLAYGLF